MTDITKTNTADPVEALRSEALLQTNLQSIDITRAAAGPTIFLDGYTNQAISLANTVDNPDGSTLLFTPDISSADIRAMLESLVQVYSRVRLIQYRRSGDGFTYNRFGRVISPNSDTTQNPVTDFGQIFGTNPISSGAYATIIAKAAIVMRSNFNKLFAIVPYCHVNCHSNVPPPPPPTCHSQQVFIPNNGDGDGGDGGGGSGDGGGGGSDGGGGSC